MCDFDVRFKQLPINNNPGLEFAAKQREKQGVPSIERTPNGRLWATWRGYYPYIILATSENDGATWTDPVAVVESPASGKVLDPNLWLDPTGRLWWYWTQKDGGIFEGRSCTWGSVTEEPEKAKPTWSKPKNLVQGLALNKPIISQNGTWLLPAVVSSSCIAVYGSSDKDKSWFLRGKAYIPDNKPCEPMIVELTDGTLWMLIRTSYGIAQSLSKDSGCTWTEGKDSGIPGPTSRFHIRRLKSGNLMMINHHNYEGRSHLTTLLSTDDGITWPHTLLLDERHDVSYPDAVETLDGWIYAIYDYSRENHKQILMSVFNEKDIIAGKPISNYSRLKALVSAP